MTGAQQNATGGKGPHFGRASGGGTRKGMAGPKSRSNSPVGRKPRDNVQELQWKLWTAAKRSPERRFHALYDRIHRDDVLWEAWRRVRRNRGAAGVDRQTLADVEAYGVERMLAELQEALRARTYRPRPLLRVEIPKPQGGRRSLGIPTVCDRVAQQAARIVLEPIFEADFLPVSWGYRPRRSATDACEVLRKGFIAGHRYAVEVDIRDCFGSIDHARLMGFVEERVSDRRVLKLLRHWLEAGVMQAGGGTQETVTGTPQGGVISPLLANVYLHRLDAAFAAHGTGEMVRYADDLVVLCRTEAAAGRAKRHIEETLARLGLEANPAKTAVVDLTDGREGFDFLGWHFRARVSGRLLERGIRRYYLHRWPSMRAMKRLRAKVKALTGRNRAGVGDIRVVIRDLNPVLRGWGNYFRTGNSSLKFRQIDRYVEGRLRGLLCRCHGRNLRPDQVRQWTRDWFRDHGLHRLTGTIRYPEVA